MDKQLVPHTSNLIVKSVVAALMELPHKTWHIHKFKGLNGADYKKMMFSLTHKDKVKNVIVFQQRTDATIIHMCERAASIKCRCDYYGQMVPPSERVGKANINLLKSINNVELFYNIFAPLQDATRTDQPFECITKVVIINGKRFPNDCVAGVVANLKAHTSATLTSTCGQVSFFKFSIG